MKKLLLLTVSVALFRLTASAAPCMNGTLASYIAMASAGCVLGSIEVSGFAYQASSEGGAAKITADQITVTPLLAPTGTFALQFSAPWSVQSDQSQLSGITYHAISPSTTNQIQQVRLDGNGFEVGMFGSVVVNETLATPVEALDLKVYMECTEVCRSQTSSILTLTPAPSALVIADRVALRSKLGTAALTSFTDWFVVCLPCA